MRRNCRQAREKPTLPVFKDDWRYPVAMCTQSLADVMRRTITNGQAPKASTNGLKWCLSRSKVIRCTSRRKLQRHLGSGRWDEIVEVIAKDENRLLQR